MLASAAMNQEEVSCSRPIRGEGMGVEDGRIPDSSLTSSSRYNNGYKASDGRLNGGVTANIKAAWIARDNDKDKWVKVSPITLIIMTILFTKETHVRINAALPEGLTLTELLTSTADLAL